MLRTIALALLGLTAWAQTQIDLRTQSKGVDFTGATSTKPMKAGSALPANCGTGEMFFNTNASAGANLYACTATNTWSAEGGSGPSSCQDAGSLNAYACNLTPTTASYTVGATYWFRAGTSNTGPATVNFNGLGAKAILKRYNAALTAGDIVAGQWVMVTYDGTAMQMQSQTASGTGTVSSVLGRTGAVTAQTGDYSFAQISGTVAETQLPATTMRTDANNTATAGTEDWSSAAHTLPMKAGTMAGIPSSCRVGETYFATDAPAGANVYGCTTANTWATEGANTVESNGQVVGTRATTNFSTGPGLLSIASDTGSNIAMLWALDTAVNQTQGNEQSGTALLCASNSGSGSNYACSMTPTASIYTAGMLVHWQPDVNGAGGPTTLNIDTLGATPVKLADGASDPAPGDIRAGRLYATWYDGTNFRLMPTTAAAVGAAGDPGTNGVLYRSGLNAASAATADQMSGPFFCQDTSSTGGAYACNLTPAISAYRAGTTYWFKANTANSGAATVNFNSVGAAAIKKQTSVNLASGDIAAGQWVMLTYDGTNMQMLSQTATAAVGGVSSVFSRAGAVTAQSGDYTTAQVPESGNLYFTNARAQAAVSWNTLTGEPSSFTPSAHAMSHQNGGPDEIATATPAANAIPKAGVGGTLAAGWVPMLNQNTTGTAAGLNAQYVDWNASSGGASIANKPTIPAASSANPAMNGTAAAGSSSSYARADHVHPTDTSRQAAITGAPSTWPSFAAVATSGSYGDLSNKPTIPAAQVQTDWNASSGLGQLLNKPTLATVATSGSYPDLVNRPTTFTPPAPTASTLGGVEAMDCSSIGLVQKINTDGTVTCAAASAAFVINTGYLKFEDEFSCSSSTSNAWCLQWSSGGTGAASVGTTGTWPHIGLESVGGSNSAAGNFGIIDSYYGVGAFNTLAASGPWELDWIFALKQTTNTVFIAGFDTMGDNLLDPNYLVGARYSTNSAYNDTTFMFCAFGASFCVSSGVAADTNYHHLKVYWISTNKIGFTLDGGTVVTACLNGGGCNISVGASWNANNEAAKIGCGSDTVAAAQAVYVDYFGFLAQVGTR